MWHTDQEAKTRSCFVARLKLTIAIPISFLLAWLVIYCPKQTSAEDIVLIYQ